MLSVSFERKLSRKILRSPIPLNNGQPSTNGRQGNDQNQVCYILSNTVSVLSEQKWSQTIPERIIYAVIL